MAQSPYESLFPVPEHDDTPSFVSQAAAPPPSLYTTMDLTSQYRSYIPMPSTAQQPPCVLPPVHPAVEFVPAGATDVPMTPMAELPPAVPPCISPEVGTVYSVCDPAHTPVVEAHIKEVPPSRASPVTLDRAQQLLAFLMLMQAIGSAVLITLDLDLVVPFSLFLGIVFIGLIGAIRRLRPLVVMHVICSAGVVAWLTTCLVIMIVGPWPPLIVVALAALTDAVMILASMQGIYWLVRRTP